MIRGPIACLALVALPALLAFQASAVRAQPVGALLAFDRPETQLKAAAATSPAAPAPPLALASPAFRAGGAIPQTYSAYGKNISPALSWTGTPRAARVLVLIVQDADSPQPKAKPPANLVQWLAYDIPANVKALSRGARNMAEPTSPVGMLQGWNWHGSYGYTGPRPPVGDPAHHYHFQLFALDRPLKVRPGAELEPVIRAMAGHVVARSDLVGLYAEPAPKPDPAAAGAPPLNTIQPSGG